MLDTRWYVMYAVLILTAIHERVSGTQPICVKRRIDPNQDNSVQSSFPGSE